MKKHQCFTCGRRFRFRIFKSLHEMNEVNYRLSHDVGWGKHGKE